VPDNWQQLGRRLVHTSDYPVSLEPLEPLGAEDGPVNLTVYNDTLSANLQLVHLRLLIGRIYRDDGRPLLSEEELAAVPEDHPLLFADL
jgi:hypothetical protein